MSARQQYWRNIQQYIWLIAGLLSLLLAFIFWIITDSKELLAQSKQIDQTQVVIQPEKVAATSNLGGLADEVRPLQMTTRKVTMGNHLAEFKGTKFFEDRKGQFSIELFRASNEDVVKSFLQKQTESKDLIYFRLSGEAQIEQYVVAYGSFKHEHEAEAALAMLPIKLPTSLKPQVIKFSDFMSSVNDLGTDEMVGANKVYAVKLRPAAVPLIDETVLAALKAAAPKPSADSNITVPTTKTTIVRKDEQGHVLDVERSQSHAEPPKRAAEPAAAEPAIEDPFN